MKLISPALVIASLPNVHESINYHSNGDFPLEKRNIGVICKALAFDLIIYFARVAELADAHG